MIDYLHIFLMYIFFCTIIYLVIQIIYFILKYIHPIDKYFNEQVSDDDNIESISCL